MKIDIFSHILPVKFKDAIPDFPEKLSIIDVTQAIWDLDLRFRIMDRFDGLMQVITLGYPPIENVADPAKAADLARLANDELAELVARHPDRFAGAVACLPMNNMDAALKEVDRAIGELGLRGVQIYVPTNDKPPESPEYIPLYEKMAKYNLPIWLHPRRAATYPDYRTMDKSLYSVYHVFGWPYETTVAMSHFVFGGIFDRFPDLKIITHHAGAMVPFFEQRIVCFYDKARTALGHDYLRGLTKAPIDYFKMFYNDTATHGSMPGLTCAHAFFGADHLLFGTDMPLGDSQRGFRITGQVIKAIEQMDIPDADKKKIFEDNARKLLRLPV